MIAHRKIVNLNLIDRFYTSTLIVGSDHRHLVPVCYQSFGQFIRTGASAFIGRTKILMDVKNIQMCKIILKIRFKRELHKPINLFKVLNILRLNFKSISWYSFQLSLVSCCLFF